MNRLKNIGFSLAVISAMGLGFSGCGGGSDSTAPVDESAVSQTDTISDETKAVLYALANTNIGYLNFSSVSTASVNQAIAKKAIKRSVDNDTQLAVEALSDALSKEGVGYSQALYEELSKNSELVSSINEISDKVGFANKLYRAIENEDKTSGFFEYIEVIADIAPAGVSDILKVYATVSPQLIKDIRDLEDVHEFNSVKLDIVFENQNGVNYSDVSDVKVHYKEQNHTSYTVGSTTQSGDSFRLDLQTNNQFNIHNKIVVEYTVNGKTLKSAYILDSSDSIKIVIQDTPPVVKASCELNNYTGELVCTNETMDNGQKLTSSSSNYDYEWYLDGDNIVDSKSFNGYYTYTNKGAYGITLTVKDSAGNEITQPVDTVNYDPESLDIEFSIDYNIANSYKEGNDVTFLISTQAYNQISSYQWSIAKPNSSQTTLLDDASSQTVYNLEAGSYTVYLTVTDINGKTTTKSFPFTSEGIETPTNSNENFTYSTITSPTTGKVWMDRNLGASQACTSYNDTACYGDYYQWGRGADGHEKSTSATTSSIATSSFPSHGDFITSSLSNNFDWTSSDSDGSTRESSWNVCPSGFHIPTIEELEAENIQNRDDAYSKLKLPSAGNRSYGSGSMSGQGSYGGIWSSSVGGSYSELLFFNSSSAYSNYGSRAHGVSVRCVRD